MISRFFVIQIWPQHERTSSVTIFHPPRPKRTIQLLETLRDHPLLSREQLQITLGWHKRTVQWHLEKLLKAKYVCLVNGRQPDVSPRSLYVLTRTGLERLALNMGLSLALFVETYRYHVARLERLILVLDRVYLVRSFLLWLKNANWGWSVAEWDVEVELEFSTMKCDLPFACHGIARLKDTQNHWIAVIVEFDTDKAPVRIECARLGRLVEGSRDDRFYDSETASFPILVILAANVDRLNDYRNLLYRIIGIEYELLPAFMTTREKWIKSSQNPTAKMWRTTEINGSWVSLLANIKGGSEHPANYLSWERLPKRHRFSEHTLEFVPLAPGTAIQHKRSQLAALSLALHALDKSLIALVGDFPLLDAVELAQIKAIPTRSVRRGLKRLQRWGLIEARAQPLRLQKTVRHQSRAERQRAKAHCYILSEKGLWLLAAWAGFSASIETYARVRGWKKRFWELVYHWDHTRIENTVYLQFLREAHRRGHQIRSWFSELESRIYFDTSYEYYSGRTYRRTRYTRKRKDLTNPTPYGDWGSELGVGDRKHFARMLAHRGHQLKSFLPDGRGVYETHEQPYSIAIEVDRTRANHKKLWEKFNYYIRSIDDREQSSWRILVVTTGWERAANIADLTVQRALAGGAFDEYRHLRGNRLIAYLKQRGMLDVALRDLLPVYVMTIETLRERGVASAIWLDARDAMNGTSNQLRYCLECFKPEARKNPERRDLGTTVPRMANENGKRTE